MGGDAEARIVDENVDIAGESGSALANEPGNIRGVSHVAADKTGLLSQTLRRPNAGFFIDVGDDDLRAFFGEAPRAGEANAVCGASDDGDPLPQPAHMPPTQKRGPVIRARAEQSSKFVCGRHCGCKAAF